MSLLLLFNYVSAPKTRLSNATESAVLKLLFQNSNWANIGDATGIRGSSTAGNLYLSLHTSDPGKTGNQSTNEISYTGYSRLAIPRTTSDWSESSGTISNLKDLLFPVCTAVDTPIATFVGIGGSSSGTGILVASGSLSVSVTFNIGRSVLIPIGDLTVQMD